MIKEKEGISAVLIVFNEETIIERCLLSLKDVVDEIIVIHDGDCTDRTLLIAKKFTNKIFVEPHTGFCEFHMIKALELVTFSWVLKLDADEYLSENLRSNIRNLIIDKHIDAYSFIWPIWDGSSYISKDVPLKTLLLRKKEISFEEFPHRSYSTMGKIVETNLVLDHKPKYNNYTIDTFKKKWLNWVKTQAFWTCKHKKIRFYNSANERIIRFHKRMEMQIRFSYPIFSPLWFLLSFGQFFSRLKICKNPKLFKVAYLQGLYAFNLCLSIWEEKRREIENNPWIN